MYVTVRDRPAGGDPAGRRAKQRVATTVVLLGTVSMFTDISSESVNAILPIYLTTVLGMSALAYGFIDGIYQGVSAVVRLLGGWIADRTGHPKWVATVGYAVSAVSRVFLIPAQTLGTITSVITADRLGKGLRTAPRDALIGASSPPDALGRSFGVHRALDTLGALAGRFWRSPFCMWCPVISDRYSSLRSRWLWWASQSCFFWCQTFVRRDSRRPARQLTLCGLVAYR